MAETDNKTLEQTIAPQNTPPAAAQPPQGRPCPKDCSKCSLGHQVYCTAKMTFDSFAVMNAIIQRIDGLTQMVSDLSVKIDAQSEKIAELSGRIAMIESEQSGFATPSPIQGDLFKEET